MGIALSAWTRTSSDLGDQCLLHALRRVPADATVESLPRPPEGALEPLRMIDDWEHGIHATMLTMVVGAEQV